MPGDVTIARLLAVLDLDAARFRRGLSQAEKTLASASKRMVDAGKKLSLSVTTPITLMGTGLSRGAVEVEKTLSEIEGLVGIAGDQVDAMGQGILQMASRVGKAPEELARGLFFVTSAGQRGTQAMDTLQVTAEAAAAGLGDVNTVADAVTSVMNAYATSNLSASDAAGILVATVREGKAEASTLAPVLGRVLPIAAELGVSFGDVGASMAAMTRIGLNAEESATSLRGALSLLQKQTKQGEEALASVGLSAERLREKLGKEGLLPVLTEIATKTKDAGDGFTQIFPNVRALTGVLALVGENAEQVETIFKSLADAGEKDLAKAFGVATETTQFRLNQAMAALNAQGERLGRQINALIVPAINGLVRVLRATGAWWNSLSDSTHRWILISVGVAAAIGPIIVVGGKLVGVLGTLVGSLKLVGVALLALTSPLGLVVVALSALAAAVFFFWDDIKPILTTIKTAIRDVFAKTVETVSNVFTAALDWMREKLRTFLEGVGWLVGQLFPELGQTIQNFADGVKGSFTAAADGVESRWETAKHRLGDAMDFIKHRADGVRGSIESWTAPLSTARLELEGLKGILDEIPAAAGKAASNVSTETERVRSDLEQSLIGSMTDFISSIGTAKNAFADFAQSVVENIKRIIAQKLAELAVEKALVAIRAAGSFFGISFASGGIVTSPTLAMIGDQGPEAVVPLKVLSKLGGGGDTIVNVHNQSGGRVETKERRGPSGDRIVDVIVHRVARDIAEGGVVQRAIEARNFVRRRGVQR